MSVYTPSDGDVRVWIHMCACVCVCVCVCVCEGRDDSNLSASFCCAVPLCASYRCGLLSINWCKLFPLLRFFVAILLFYIKALLFVNLQFSHLFHLSVFDIFRQHFFYTQHPLHSLNLLKMFYRSVSLLCLTINVERPALFTVAPASEVLKHTVWLGSGPF